MRLQKVLECSILAKLMAGHQGGGTPGSKNLCRSAIAWKDLCSVTESGPRAPKQTVAAAGAPGMGHPRGLEGAQLPLLLGACVGLEPAQPFPVLSQHDFNRGSVLGMFSPQKSRLAEQDLGRSG